MIGLLATASLAVSAPSATPDTPPQPQHGFYEGAARDIRASAVSFHLRAADDTVEGFRYGFIRAKEPARVHEHKFSVLLTTTLVADGHWTANDVVEGVIRRRGDSLKSTLAEFTIRHE